MAFATVAGTRIAPPVVERFGSRGPVRVGTVLLCVALLGPALASSYAAFCRGACRCSAPLGGFLDVAFNAQGIAVQRAYGRPILAGLHGIWSSACSPAGASAPLAAALGLSPTAHFAIVAAAARRCQRAAARVAAPARADEPPHPHDRAHLPLPPQVLAARRDRVRGLRRRGRGGGLERDLRARPPGRRAAGAAASRWRLSARRWPVARFVGDRVT